MPLKSKPNLEEKIQARLLAKQQAEKQAELQAELQVQLQEKIQERAQSRVAPSWSASGASLGFTSSQDFGANLAGADGPKAAPMGMSTPLVRPTVHPSRYREPSKVNVTHDLREDSYLVTHEVGPSQNGIRLDAFLKERYRKRSREAIKRAIESGAITLERNQGPHVSVGRLKPSSQLMAGDQVLVLSERKPEPEVSFDYKVLFEDEVLFVIEKPANLPVHPAGRYFFNTLLVHLKTRGHQDPLRAEREYFLVHRIDKETSGILVLAKDRDVATHLTRQFFERTTEKFYLAVVHGVPPEDFIVDHPMKKATGSLIDLKMTIAPPDEEGSLPAMTGFRRLETAGNFSLVECFPKTGRQHQIRVHLDSVGHPIVGDKLYGMPENEAVRFYERQHLTPEAEAKLILPRHALHSAGIRFDHPLTGKRLEFRSELPADLRRFLDSQNEPKPSIPAVTPRGEPVASL